MRDTALTATIRSVGPHKSFKLTLPGAGLHLLLGPPESGKSYLERALTAAVEAGGKEDVRRLRVEVSWDAKTTAGRGLPEGQVTIPGLTGGAAGINLRADGRVTRLPDPPAVTLLAGDNFAALTRHGLVGEKERNAAELRTFAEITGITTAPTALVPIEQSSFFEDIPEGPLSQVAEEVRKRGHALKARALDDAAALERKVGILKAAADKGPFTNAITVDTALSAQRRAEEVAAQLRIDRKGRVKAESERELHRALHPETRPDPAVAVEKAKAARAALDTLIDSASEGLPEAPDVESARDLVTVTAGNVTRGDQELTDLRQRISDLQRAEAVAASSLERAKADAVAAEKAVQAAELAHATWQVKADAYKERAQAIRDARKACDDAEADAHGADQRARAWDARDALLASPIEGPEQEEVDAAAVEVERAIAAVDLARRAYAEAIRAADEESQTEALNAARERAETFETIATTGLRARIRAVLEAADIKGWGISDDGALTCADPARGGDLVPFSALSGSTKDAAAMGLILAHATEQGDGRYLVMLLPQEVADGMIQAQLSALSTTAKERGVYIVGGKVADGDLRIESV